MNKFAEIKSLLKGEEVIEHYLGTPYKRTNKGIWYKSPFRQEKTASFYVSEKGIHDFGSSEHYDIISFVVKYFNTDNLQALKILCNDFGLSLFEEQESKESIKQQKQKREEEKRKKEKIEKWYNSQMQKICDEIQENEKIIKILKKTSYFETLKILYEREVKLEIEFEKMQNAKNKEKLYEEISLWKENQEKKKNN